MTDQLQDAFARQDEVSASLVLEMRAEEIEKAEACIAQIWDLAAQGQDAPDQIRRLLNTDPFSYTPGKNWEENKIFEIRQKTIQLIQKLQESDRRLSLRAGGEKSFYRKTT